MQDNMDSETAAFDSAPGDDLSALAWVHGELRRSLETAHKALRRYLKDADAATGGDLDVVDPSVLRGARTQLHQGVGALELVGLPAVADVLRASESAVQRMVAKPALVSQAAVEVVERVSFALLDFLTRLLARKPVSPVMLFPQYRAALQLAGADRVHPADLWKVDWQWLELPHDQRATPHPADDTARSAMETLVLALMREPSPAALAAMSNLCADLGAGARLVSGGTGLGSLWQMAAAVFEAQAQGLLGIDVYSKRLASRLLAQLRSTVKGQAEPSDRLAQDLLFFCSHARLPSQGVKAPRLEAVRQLWRLQEQPVADYETPRLGRFDPAHLLLARKRVAAAKESWSAVAGGEQHRIVGLPEQFALVGESLQRLFPSGEVLAQALQSTVAQTVQSGQAPPAALAMEVATSILYLDASLEDGELDQPELAERVQRLAGRMDSVRQGADPQSLDIWMEELYRRVSDRQTMGSVVQELRSSLSEVEKQIDQYFRNPAERQVLIPVPAQLSSMRGVLSVLGMTQASQAALHMRDDVDALAQTEVDPQRAIQTGTFDRLANNLGALSFLIDMLSVQPQLAKSLFRFDPETGVLSAVMGRTDRVSAFAQLDEVDVGAPSAPAAGSNPLPLLAQIQALGVAAAQAGVSDASLARDADRLAQQALAADQPDLARLLATAHRGLLDSADTESRLALRAELSAATQSLGVLGPEAAPAPAPVPPPSVAPKGGTGLEDDAEMRDVFIEEAREVVTDAQAAVERLQGAPDSTQDMTAVRRAFHTLKGSSRMVGLRDFGEAAWSCEQLFNARLALEPHMDPPLRLCTTEALAYLGSWVEAIAHGRNEGHHTAAVARSAEALRLDGIRVPIVLPQAIPSIPSPDTTLAVERTVELARTTIALNRAPEKGQEQSTVILARHAADGPTVSIPRVAADGPTVIMARAAAEPALDEPATLADFVLPPLDPDAPLAAPADMSDPVADRASTPAPVASDGDFEFVLPELEAFELPADPTEQPLSMRVPDLPTAADLDLGLPELAAPAQTVSADAAAEEISFDLDLGNLSEPEDASGTVAAAQPDGLASSLVQPAASVEAIEMDLDELGDIFGADLSHSAAVPSPLLQAPAESSDLPLEMDALAADGSTEPADQLMPELEAEEQVKVIGPLRISIPLFNIYLNEADELSRRLVSELGEWALEADHHPVSDTAVALAHSLAGNSATVGFVDLSALARSLEHALERSQSAGHGRPGEASLFMDAAEEIRRLLHQFAAGFLRQVDVGLTDRLQAHERLPVATADEMVAFDQQTDEVTPARDAEQLGSPSPGIVQLDDEFDAVDAIDAELFPIFEEEADELLPQLQGRLREWHDHPGNAAAPAACMRTLHTFKGGARLAGAMRLGEMAHVLESAIERLAVQEGLQAHELDPLVARADAMAAAFEALRRPQPTASLAPLSPAAFSVEEPQPTPALQAVLPELEALDLDLVASSEAPANALVIPAEPLTAPLVQPSIDWSRFKAEADAPAELPADRVAATGAAVRVRAGLLDRLVNNAGEVSITRSRIDSTVQQLQGSLAELTESLERLRRQLRDIELQAETQISSRMEAAKASLQTFDPLEMDRFTRFQELTRFMAESVNDVATLQRSLQRSLQSAEDELAAQARLTRELQDDLLRTRMVEFESMADRLYRTVRQAARETAKQVRLDIVGGGIEMDRGVLERMVGSFEHLIRNCVAHGVESPAAREAVGKAASGLITITVSQAGNEVAVEVADDGAGLDLVRIRQRGLERGLLQPDGTPLDSELQQLIFAPGFSTADSVTELAGRGVGLDVVRAEVNAMGGRIETSSELGRGARFRLLLPLTTAVTQVVMLRCGELRVAVPSPLIEVVRRVPTPEVEAAYQSGSLAYNGEAVPFFWLASLLQFGGRGSDKGRTQSVVVIRSASQRVVVHVDEVIGNQEVVVKNVGPQLSKLPGLAGVTLLPSGAVALIYNPVALATVYASTARAVALTPAVLPSVLDAAATAERPVQTSPMVLVVDDSLTVRRVTQRLLTREGYRVVTAKDGLDALERLAEERPAVMLSDIEMPRMDGFDLLRNVRADSRLAGLPVVMISSRIAQKHRDYASELGVDHYLGKPFSEEELLGLVAGYVRAHVAH
jgi:chemosensory pili system protein ChpA (sensor histidine kinase/response regulator)